MGSSPAAAAVRADDELLVNQARQGDERAFATLYRRHVRYVAGVIHRITGNDSELDDILQEAFVDAAAGLHSLREPGGFRPWLVSITIRRLHRRLARRRRMRWLRTAVEQLMPVASDPSDRQEVDALYEALDGVPPKLRVPWVLHSIEGETLPEVARMCEVSLATVKRRIADADERIKRRLNG